MVDPNKQQTEMGVPADNDEHAGCRYEIHRQREIATQLAAELAAAVLCAERIHLLYSTTDDCTDEVEWLLADLKKFHPASKTPPETDSPDPLAELPKPTDVLQPFAVSGQETADPDGDYYYRPSVDSLFIVLQQRANTAERQTAAMSEQTFRYEKAADDAIADRDRLAAELAAVKIDAALLDVYEDYFDIDGERNPTEIQRLLDIWVRECTSREPGVYFNKIPATDKENDDE